MSWSTFCPITAWVQGENRRGNKLPVEAQTPKASPGLWKTGQGSLIPHRVLAERQREGGNLFTLSLSVAFSWGSRPRETDSDLARGAGLTVRSRAAPNSSAHRLSPQTLHLHKFFIERVSQSCSPFWLLLK